MDERGQQPSGPDHGDGSPPEGTVGGGGQDETGWFAAGGGTRPTGGDTRQSGAGTSSEGDVPAFTGAAGPDASAARPRLPGDGQFPPGAEPGPGAPGGVKADGTQDRPTWGAAATVGTAAKNRSWKKTVGAVAVAAVVVTGGVFGVNAMAAGSEGTAASTQRGVGGAGGLGGYGQSGFPGAMGGTGGSQGRQSTGQFGLGAALHGDFVVSSGSTYETRRMQRGTISAIGGGTVSITSYDGYSCEYAVGDVDVSSLAVGATVVVIATVSGDTATVTSLVSATAVGGASGQQGGTGPQSGTDPQQDGTSPQGGTDPQQDGTSPQGGPGMQDGTDGQRNGEQSPTTSGTTSDA